MDAARMVYYHYEDHPTAHSTSVATNDLLCAERAVVLSYPEGAT